MHTARNALGAVAALCFLWAVPVSNGATVSLSASAATVAEGGSVTFTCTVTPSNDVSRVTFSYEDGSGSDVITSSPYQVTHVFNTPMDALTVTATVTYTGDAPADQAMVDIDVVGLSLSGGAAPTRGYSTTYQAQSNPAGKAISQFDWAYTAGSITNTYTDYDADRDGISSWSGKMVVSGALVVQATVSGVSCRKEMAVSVNTRAGWTLPVTCAQDNEPDWGDEPTEGAANAGGRDRDSNDPFRFFVPQPTAGDFSTAVTLSRASSGPCADWWYVMASTLKCQRETVINKYIKSGGPVPAGGWENFFDHNNANCLAGATADFVQAWKNHEYRGTPDTPRSETGHFGRAERGIGDGEIAGDPKLAIEPLTARTRADLQAAVDRTVCRVESALRNYAISETWAASGPNWGGVGGLGVGLHATWIPALLGWTDCNTWPGYF